MNLEGNKSTQCIFKKHEYIEDNEGLVIKQPVGEDILIKGILLPVSGERYIAAYGADIRYIYRYLIKPNPNVVIGDYIIHKNNNYDIIAIEEWPKYYTLLIKVEK